MLFAAPALLIGLGLGVWLNSWRVVVALVVVGLVVSMVGWRAAWFADEDTPALGGALVFELIICAPIAIGAGVGVYLIRSRVRRRRDDESTLPVICPPPDRRHEW